MAYYLCQCGNKFKDEPYEINHPCPLCGRLSNQRIEKPRVKHLKEEAIERRFKTNFPKGF